jgi:hypothetical protein
MRISWESLAPLLRFGIAALQFGLLVLLIRTFSIESRAFLRVAALAWGGFVIHHFLPLRLRLPFFGCLSIGAVVLMFGAVNAAWLVATGLVLIAILHLPIVFAARIGLLAGAGGVLWTLRSGAIDSPFPEVIWPIFGSMFMFRLIVYAYDLRHQAAPVSFWRAIGYFFLLPNVCFPLFPVVDYKTFCRTYHAEDEIEGYQRGVIWMLRGCIQLLLYRLVYQHLVVDPASISTGGQAVQLIVTTYLIYLKVSGSFHLIVGMLRMFCFHLPETNHNWLLSSSFTDFWRRINIYWKDFILKVFFNPVYFPLRRRFGDTRAIVASTFFAFFVTWLLHSYQWFWIRGAFPIKWQDGVFWTLLGAIVSVNILWEQRRGRRRSLGKVRRSLRDELLLALRTVGTFVAVVMSWSIWTAESAAELQHTWGQLLHLAPVELGWVLLGLMALGAAAIVIGRTRLEQSSVERQKQQSADPWWFGRSAATVCALCALLLFAGGRPAALAFAPRLAGVVDQLTESKLNSIDAKRLERGYYEDLVDVGRFHDQLATLSTLAPRDWDGTEPKVRQTGGYTPYELIPSTRRMHKGVHQGVNQWGMRDREYTLAKPPGTYRIALLGASHSKGSGVEDWETYENLVEDRLNAEAPPGVRYEILNFSTGGYGPLSRLAILEKRVRRFDPDAVIYVAIDDYVWIVNELTTATEKGHEIPFDHVLGVVRDASVSPGLARVVAEQRLRPHAPELVEWIYREIVAHCRAAGVRPLATVLPRPEDISNEAELMESQAELARAAGFEMLDLGGAYAGTEKWPELWIAPWDRHPNPEAHARVANLLYADLRRVLDAPDL